MGQYETLPFLVRVADRNRITGPPQRLNCVLTTGKRRIADNELEWDIHFHIDGLGIGSRACEHQAQAEKSKQLLFHIASSCESGETHADQPDLPVLYCVRLPPRHLAMVLKTVAVWWECRWHARANRSGYQLGLRNSTQCFEVHGCIAKAMSSRPGPLSLTERLIIANYAVRKCACTPRPTVLNTNVRVAHESQTPRNRWPFSGRRFLFARGKRLHRQRAIE